MCWLYVGPAAVVFVSMGSDGWLVVVTIQECVCMDGFHCGVVVYCYPGTNNPECNGGAAYN